MQPTLVGYALGQPSGQQLALDPSAMTGDRSLLLDTFLQLVLCHGSQIGQLRRNPETANEPALTQLETTARADMAEIASKRFPAPEVFECEQFQSKARYLVQKLNPDVTLTTFLQGLYKAIVA